MTADNDRRSRALDGLRVIEFGGIGPAPFAGMMLADMGADVIRLDRVGSTYWDVLMRGKRSVELDVRDERGAEIVRRLLSTADALVEGFRPGVLERLGFAPDRCWSVNPQLVIGRMTGWGQEGPLAQVAGHDINYVGLSGALHAIGDRSTPPTIPLNLVGDYGGGGLLMAFGVVCAVLEAARSGQGQVVDAAMVDGAALLMTKWYAEHAAGRWVDHRQSNFVDGASHFYRVYETADGRYVAVGALEPKFYERLLELLGIDAEELGPQMDPASWPAAAERLAEIFRQRTREEWLAEFEGEDVCVTPVLGLSEAPGHPHLRARHVFEERADGSMLPAPAPRLSRTPPVAGDAPALGSHSTEVLTEIGVDPAEVDRLRAGGVVG